MKTSEFLFPTALRTTPSAISKVLFVGSCMIQNMLEEMKAQNPQVHFDWMLYNSVLDLPQSPPAAAADYQFQYLHLPLTSILQDRMAQFGELTGEAREALLHDAFSLVELMLNAGLRYNEEHGLLTFVANFLVPQSPIVAALKNTGTEDDLVQLIRRLNDHLARLIAERPNVYLADIDALASSLGKAAVMDDWYHVYSHNAVFLDYQEDAGPPFHLQYNSLDIGQFRPSKADEFFGLMWSQAEALFRSVTGVDKVKLVVFDLDNTVIRGQIAEDYRDEVVWPLMNGWPEGIAEAIQHLRARGVLIALSSKNDEEVVRRLWSRIHSFHQLSLDDFVTIRINWSPKPDNIADILQELSLTQKSVVFVDDNPLEREAVRLSLPDVRIIGENQFLTRNILLRAPETQTPVLTGEAKRREDMMRSQVRRETQRASLSREAFLAGLDLEVGFETITGEDHPKFVRARELVNRTNQFNTTGVRWSPQAFTTLFRHGGALLTVSAKDRFADYGLIAVLVLRGDLIDQFVLSCRVLGLGVERAALARAIADIRSRQKRPDVLARTAETRDNLVSRTVYGDNGFAPDQGAGDMWVYRGATPSVPSHIRIVTESAAA